MLKATDNPHSEPGKPISAAFEPHMGIFVDAQDKYVLLLQIDRLTHSLHQFRVLADMLAPHRKSRFGKTQTQPRVSTDTAAGDNNSSPMAVLPSSTDLFYLYGQVLEQCAKLSTGQPLYDLCTLFKKWLRIYAGMSGVMWLANPLKLTTLCCVEEVLAINTKR